MLSANAELNRTLATLEAIRDADYHTAGLGCRPLFRIVPHFFAQLLAEAQRFHDVMRPSEVASADHVSNWIGPRGRVFQYSLLNRSGASDDATSDHDASCLGKAFHHGASFPSIAQLIGSFPHCINFRLNGLGPGAELAPHKEHVTFATRNGRVAVRARFHLPLVTNRRAHVLIAGDVLHLEAGTVYFFNNGCVHAARNRGDALRLHFVWDMLMTAEASLAMFGTGEAPRGLERIEAGEGTLVRDGFEQPVEYTTYEPFVERTAARALEFCDEQ